MKSSLLLGLLVITSSILGAALTILFVRSEVKPTNPCEYKFIVTDDSLTVYDEIDTLGTVKLEGQLDSLITLDNQ